MKNFIYRMKEAIPQKIAWLLPRAVVYWASIRLMCHATQGEYSNQNVTELGVVDALKRW